MTRPPSNATELPMPSDDRIEFHVRTAQSLDAIRFRFGDKIIAGIHDQIFHYEDISIKSTGSEPYHYSRGNLNALLMVIFMAHPQYDFMAAKDAINSYFTQLMEKKRDYVNRTKNKV